MDRAIYRLITLAVIAFALWYFWTNYNSIRTEVQAFAAGWWH
jgi:hypothetical protein